MRHETVPTRLLLVSADPALKREARAASDRLGVPIDVMPSLDDALSWLLRPDRLCSHVLAPASLDPARIEALAGMVDEVTSWPTPLFLLGAEDDHSPAVLATEGRVLAAIEHLLRDHRPFVPPELPDITEQELRDALHVGMLHMRFQPILDIHNLSPVGVEALARIHHPRLGILRPQDFMPQAIASGQERALTGIVAARSMLDLRPLPGLPAGGFAINVPLSTLHHVWATERAVELCAVVGVKPHQVVIEVLETPEPPDLRLLTEAVERWRAYGFEITIDDAGPDLPHWRALIDLPFTGIKLDGRLAVDTEDARFEVSDIASAARKRGLSVTAEGIEDEATLIRMRGLGVDMVQGFYFCRPLPGRALPIWLREWRSGELGPAEVRGEITATPV